MNEETTMYKETGYENNEEIAVYEEPETSNGGLGKALVALAAVGGAIAFAMHKTKDWREQRRIKKLEAKGYVVYSPGEMLENAPVVSNESENAVAKEEKK